ncbi:MAG: FtsX-like permease family protein, partial [Vicinamibacterales bacterium]
MVEHLWTEGVSVQRNLAYAIRSERSGSPTLLKEVQQAVWSINPNLPVANVRTLEEIQAETRSQTSFALVMLSIAAGVALLLGVVGIYGVISYIAAQRTREIGIRMALGAARRDVSGLFLRHGLVLSGIGIALGAA